MEITMYLTKQDQDEIIDALRYEYDIEDVRFVKGRLFIENREDVDTVVQFLEDQSLAISYQYVEEDEFAY